MKKRDGISNEEYAATLGCAGLIAMAFVIAMFAGGAYAITQIFDLPGWLGVVLFLGCMALWVRKPKAS